jgi:hypothetical protein
MNKDAQEVASPSNWIPPGSGSSSIDLYQSAARQAVPDGCENQYEESEIAIFTSFFDKNLN